MKTSNSDTEEGYLIQWQKSDPVLGNGDDAQPYEVYANADSYLVNPLRFSDGGENQWDKPSVKCIEDGTGGHFIAVEIRFNKKILLVTGAVFFIVGFFKTVSMCISVFIFPPMLKLEPKAIWQVFRHFSSCKMFPINLAL